MYCLNLSRSRQAVILLLSLCSTGLGQNRNTAVSRPKMFRYPTPNGGVITLTELGQIIGFGKNKECLPAKESCLVRTFAFIDQDPATGKQRVLYDVLNKRSKVFGEQGDLVPVRYDGPPSGTKIEPGKDVQARVTLKSRDGASVIDLTYRISERVVTIAFVTHGGTQTPTGPAQCGGKPCSFLLEGLYCEDASCSPYIPPEPQNDPIITVDGPQGKRVMRPLTVSNLDASINRGQQGILTGNTIALNVPAGGAR
jgi:hypothetical protein